LAIQQVGSLRHEGCAARVDALALKQDIEAVPLYEYELCEGSCAACGGRFTLRRPLSAPPLTQCPACKKPVRKVFSTFNSPKALSISDAKKAGFTVLKKVSKGEYERQ
jgi:putative FmdB family regulatory protein